MRAMRRKYTNERLKRTSRSVHTQDFKASKHHDRIDGPCKESRYCNHASATGPKIQWLYSPFHEPVGSKAPVPICTYTTSKGVSEIFSCSRILAHSTNDMYTYEVTSLNCDREEPRSHRWSRIYFQKQYSKSNDVDGVCFGSTYPWCSIPVDVSERKVQQLKHHRQQSLVV